MTEPAPSRDVCHYAEPDSRAQIRSNDDGSWSSRCNCLTVCCESGTYDEAVDALDTHRAETA